VPASSAATGSGLERALALLEPELREGVGPRMREGYLDLIGDAGYESTGSGQDLMLSGIVPRIYERWWRPALGRLAKGLLGPSMDDEHRIARLLLGLSPGDGVLDVACGPGNFTREFARAVGDSGLAIGMDVSETMLARAVRDTRGSGLAQVGYVRADAVEMPFRSQSFDAVCCFAALHFFSDPMAALDRMTEVLTPGGRIAILTSVRGRTAPLRTFESLVEAQSGMRMFERWQITGALEARGFVDIHQRLAGLAQFVGARLAA
jgi:ubiquinone/menaquinone biosynthesis C-methylase UbiE